MRLTIMLPGAKQVEVVGTFDGGSEERWAMNSGEGGRWWIELPADASRTSREFLFHYLIDGAFCVLDSGVHLTRTSAAGIEMSRVLMPAA